MGREVGLGRADGLEVAPMFSFGNTRVKFMAFSGWSAHIRSQHQHTPRGGMLPVVRQAQLESSQTCINAESESGTERTTLLSACSSTDAKLPGILHYKKLAFNLNDSVVNCTALK